MEKKFFRFIFYSVFISFLASPIYARLISPSPKDSIVAGNYLPLVFSSEGYALHSLFFSTDGGKNFSTALVSTDETNLMWFPPQKDYDSIIFRYSSIGFKSPRLLYRINNLHTKEITAISFSPDSSVLATSSLDGKIFILETSGGRKIDSLNIWPKKIFNVIFLWNAGNLLFSTDSELYFWNRRFNLVQKLYSAEGIIRAIDFNKRGIIAFGSYDRSFVVFDLRLVRLLTYYNDSEIYSTEISEDGRFVAFGDYNGIVRIFDLQKRSLINVINTNKTQSMRNVVWSLTFSKDSKNISTGGIDGYIDIWEIETGKRISSIQAHNFQIRGINLNDNFPIVLSVSLDSTIKQIYFESSKPIHEPIHEISQIVSFDITAGKSLFAVGLRNGDLAIYRNFEINRDSSIQSNRFFIPMKVKSGPVLAKVGEVAVLPIIVQNPLGINLENFATDTSYADFIYPNRFFVVMNKNLQGYDSDGIARISSSLKNIFSEDTFAVVKIWVMDNDSMKAFFWVNDIDFRGKNNLLWEVETDSIEIYENCPTVRQLTSFIIDEGLDYEFYPNPSSSNLMLKIFSTYPESIVVIDLIDAVGRSRAKLFEGKVTKGVNFVNFDLNDLATGIYFIVLRYNGKSLAKKLIIHR